MSAPIADALRRAIAANERWSPPSPTPLHELAPGKLIPPLAVKVAQDLGFTEEEAQEIARVFFEHLGSHPESPHTVEEIVADPQGQSMGFAFFWGFLASQRLEKELGGR